jgi:hypothetical protein
VIAARGPWLELRGLKHFRLQENQPLVPVHARLVRGLAVVEVRPPECACQVLVEY